MTAAITAIGVTLVALAVVPFAPRPQGRQPVAGQIRGVVALIDATAPQDDIFNAQFCGGVLVGPDTVLTAAHCVAGRGPSDLDAVVGANNLCRGMPIDGVRSRIAKITLDPVYNPATQDHDLATLDLVDSFGNGSRDIVQGSGASASLSATALGWGRASFGGVPSCGLTAVAINVDSTGDCASRIGQVTPQVFDPETMICGTPPDGSTADTCSGDSGGPLFVGDPSTTGAVLGIVSWGRGCGDGVPGVYARADLLSGTTP